MDNERKECTFLWFIEKYSYCWHENRKPLRSPRFSFDALEGTDWYLVLHPRGYRNEDRGNISLFLWRSTNDAGPEYFSVEYELSVLVADGSGPHSREFESKFKKNDMRGFYQFVQRDDIHLRRKSEYLPNDTLSVCCKMWKGESNVENAEQISARTRILIEKISFLHVVENFSTLQPNVKKTIKIRSNSVEGGFLTISLYYTDGSCEEKIIIEIVSSDDKKILHKCEISLLEGSGNIIKCEGNDYAHGSERINIQKLLLSLTRRVILDRKSEYLPDDKLSLLCECTFSLGLISHEIEETRHEMPLAVMKQKRNHAHDAYKNAEKFPWYPIGSEDMKTIYKIHCFADVELKTKTKSFPAHKIILCSRSPVFKTMMISDMKEKNTDCIEVDDLENDTVEQLLLCLYSDSLPNIQLKSATQLYYAADKYQIGKLKEMCFSFFTQNLSTSNASDLLHLADTHNDSNLRKVVEDFILEHKDQVFGSNGWEKLIESNPQLVIKTMQLIYKRNAFNWNSFTKRLLTYINPTLALFKEIMHVLFGLIFFFSIFKLLL
ncbi:Speckle-type POZ protein [Araneus ventricosus]|uniref:Speckle-type POZ protein n=1 Tax=Araneus ventricosus TaxID=182803 RepID=A0A4Y2HP60_ARAVE|nr:Speckle-type POZ protein [Araneus ventricosus]